MVSENAKWKITKKQQLAFIKVLTDNLTMLRSKVGISQGELASLVGISRQTYSSIECRKRIMSWNTYLSLILFFDYNSTTHQLIRDIEAFPKTFVSVLNNGQHEIGSNGIAGIPQTITDKLDEQALYAIRTVVMVEYARCVNLSSEEVVKAFEGTTIRRSNSEKDAAIEKAIRKIKEGRK